MKCRRICIIAVLISFSSLRISAQPLFEKDLYDLAKDSLWASAVDTVCTYRVRTKGISNQGNSGRCWYFSTLNMLRAELMQDHPELGEFHFSYAFGQYWDLAEKCRHWLDMARKCCSKPSRSRHDDFLFKKPIGDGGHFLNAAHLISKYGVVPLDVMPEVYSSSNNVTLMNTLRTILRKYGLKYRHSPKREHDAITEAAICDVMTVLDRMLGTPPSEFDWGGRHWTPLSFRDEYVKHDMQNDYALMMNDPSLPYYKVYEVSESRNCLEGDNWSFLNLPADVLDSLGVMSLKGGRMFCISADVSHEGDARMGIYDTRLYNVEPLLGVDLDMTKREMSLSCESRSVHAMAVCGVRLDDSGNAEQWLVENSFGPVRGWDGFVVLSSAWLDKYQWRCIVEKRFLPESLKKLYGQRPRKIPAWYPLY